MMPGSRVPGRQSRGMRDVDPELQAVARTRDLHALVLRAGDFRARRPCCWSASCSCRSGAFAQIRVGDHRRRLVRVDVLRVVVVERASRTRRTRRPGSRRCASAAPVSMSSLSTHGRGACVVQFAPGMRVPDTNTVLLSRADDDVLAARSVRASVASAPPPAVESPPPPPKPAPPRPPPPNPPPPAGKRHAASEVESLRRIGRARREHGAAVGHEHRLGRRRCTRRASGADCPRDDLRVARPVRWQPAHVSNARRLRTRCCRAAATCAASGAPAVSIVLKTPTACTRGPVQPDSTGCFACPCPTPSAAAPPRPAGAARRRRCAHLRAAASSISVAIDLARRVPQLLHRAEARHRHEVRERLDHPRDAEILPVG